MEYEETEVFKIGEHLRVRKNEVENTLSGLLMEEFFKLEVGKLSKQFVTISTENERHYWKPMLRLR